MALPADSTATHAAHLNLVRCHRAGEIRERKYYTTAHRGGGLLQGVVTPVEQAVAPGRVLDVAGGLLRLVAVHVADHAARAGFGVLVGVLGMAGLRTDELARPLAMAAGLASAAAGRPVVSPLFLGPVAWSVPAGRFSGLIVCAIAGAGLGRSNRG